MDGPEDRLRLLDLLPLLSFPTTQVEGLVALFMLSFIATASLLLAGAAVPVQAAAVRSHGAVHDPLPEYINRNLGPYSPWYPAGTYRAVPAHCTLEQVNILQRHGAPEPYLERARFVRTYRYELGADALTPLGAQQSRVAGEAAYERYRRLVKGGRRRPFVRSDSSPRVVDSAGNWTDGFYAQAGRRSHPTTLVISNAAGSNDTLDDNNCDLAPDLSSYETTYLDIFAANATARLNAAAPGAGLTNTDTLNFMQLCGFESEYMGRISPWCGLFTQAEFEYYYDLAKYYGNGAGNPLGPIQGVGYVNELLSRLTGDRQYALADETQVNQTLAQSQSTFPLGAGARGPAVFADFSHDNEIVSILAAIGLKRPRKPLPAAGPSEAGRGEQVWRTSEIVPFGGRLVTERLNCHGEEFVRFFINEQLQIPTFCADANVRTGLCSLDNFVASQAYARANGNGDYLECGYKPF